MNADTSSLFDTIPCPHCGGHGQISAWAPNHRTTDPTTSTNAGRRTAERLDVINHGTKRHRVLEAFSIRNMTAVEAATLVDSNSHASIEGTRRRVSDLARGGFIVDSGQRRPNPGSSDPAIVWTITSKGTETLKRLQKH